MTVGCKTSQNHWLYGTLALALAVCGVALAQNESSTTEPVVSPTATPSPPKKVQNHTFILRDNGSASVCLHMVAVIVINITYHNSSNLTTSRSIPLTDNVVINSKSQCNIGGTSASLIMEPIMEDMEDMPLFNLTFNFTGTMKTGQQHWSGDAIELILDTGLLEYYDPTIGDVTFNTSSSLFDASNRKIEFTRSYYCSSEQSLDFDEGYNITIVAGVSDLQVQAFKFNNPTTGAFDNARVCLMDSAGKANKIVPIAVGAALAGLVVVVLIAYLIGRLRSRRQSSYEALS